MLKTRENVARKKQATREPQIKTEWLYTSEVTPGFRKLMSILLREQVKEGKT